jgi:hypothetical protein
VLAWLTFRGRARQRRGNQLGHLAGMDSVEGVVIAGGGRVKVFIEGDANSLVRSTKTAQTAPQQREPRARPPQTPELLPPGSTGGRLGLQVNAAVGPPMQRYDRGALRQRLLVSSIVMFVMIVLVGCGGSSTTTTTPASTTSASTQTQATLSDKEQIELIGETWASLFAKKDPRWCAMATGAMGMPLACVIYTDQRSPDCRPPRQAITPACSLPTNPSSPPTKFERSFGGATVTHVNLSGSKALALFSNGEAVEFTYENGHWGPSTWRRDGAAGKELTTLR